MQWADRRMEGFKPQDVLMYCIKIQSATFLTVVS